MTILESFNVWLDSPMTADSKGQSRREYAKNLGINEKDLEWAFCSGFNRGSDYVLKALGVTHENL